ncbi:MAG TPA: hypothetical protein VEX43_03555 [Chthoniobacterales bacterium]|nr:hypothetical protein [Chthoniobacterales bacterium]
MDPVFLATVTSAITHLAMEVMNGVASEASVSLWKTISEKLGFSATPRKEELAPLVAGKLQTDQDLACVIADLLQNKLSSTDVTALVGRIDAKGAKVTVIHTVNVSSGGFTISN